MSQVKSAYFHAIKSTRCYYLYMRRLNVEHSAEEFLYGEGLISRRSVQRRALLDCIGCRWLKAAESGEETRFHGQELVRCTLVKSGVVYPILNHLAAVGAVVRESEDVSISLGRPARVYYYPADSKLGEAFWNELQVPDECPLEQDAAQAGIC